jgi:hypothetical protein
MSPSPWLAMNCSPDLECAVCHAKSASRRPQVALRLFQSDLDCKVSCLASNFSKAGTFENSSSDAAFERSIAPDGPARDLSPQVAVSEIPQRKHSTACMFPTHSCHNLPQLSNVARDNRGKVGKL